MEYVYEDNKTTNRPIVPMCLNLPTAINYADSVDLCGEKEEDWDALNFGGSSSTSILTSGSYKIFMKSQTGTDAVRELCFLKKIK